MSDWTARIVSLFACALGAAAIVVNLAHGGPVGPAGPAGPQGKQGAPGKAAKAAVTRGLGVCWNDQSFTQDWANGSSSTWISYVSIDQPQLINDVYSCPQGDTFTSAVPQASAQP